MLKRTIDADTYNSLPDDVKSHYVKRGNNYVIDLEGSDPEVAATQSALDAERKKNITLESQVRTLTEEKATIVEDAKKETAEELAKLKEQNEQYTAAMIEGEQMKHVNAIASKFKAEDLLRSDLKNRVKVEIVEGKPQTKFFDKNGKEVEFKVLDDEYCKNPDYSGILKTPANTQAYVPPTGGQQGGQQEQNKQQKQLPNGIDYNSPDKTALKARLEQIT